MFNNYFHDSQDREVEAQAQPLGDLEAEFVTPQKDRRNDDFADFAWKQLFEESPEKLEDMKNLRQNRMLLAKMRKQAKDIIKAATHVPGQCDLGDWVKLPSRPQEQDMFPIDALAAYR